MRAKRTTCCRASCAARPISEATATMSSTSDRKCWWQRPRAWSCRPKRVLAYASIPSFAAASPNEHGGWFRITIARPRGGRRMTGIARLLISGLLAWGAVAIPALAQETTPAMLDAAAKEGKVVWYSSVDVKVAEAIAQAFKAAYPKIDVDVERSGSERVFQRINQEHQSGIRNVDVVNSSDASHF